MDVSICFPTAGRPAYLDAALASVAPQARAHDAEIVVVVDGPEDAELRVVIERHGARAVVHGARRGVNAARNTCLDTARGELVILLDDDVEVWPVWLDALVAAAREKPEVDVFGGPILPRLEGADLRLCGREPVAITALDRDIGLAWGANLALRRRAVERAGRFDERLSQIGDEEEWEHRLRDAGGEILFVPAAGVHHRRAGADATLRALARGNWHRGRQARRYDVHKGSPPSLLRELRVLVGCLYHLTVRRCDNGWLLAALAAGRIAEALDPAPSPFAAGPDFLSGESGTRSRRDRARGAVADALAGALLLPARPALARAARRTPRRRVLVLCVARPEHHDRAAASGRELERARHHVDMRLVPPAPGAGKWANLNAALGEHLRDDHDWLVLVDDDVVLPRGFLDRFLACAERLGLRLAQPAHAATSHASWRVTRRRPAAVARRTRFVEIGPVTALHRDTFATLLPFPDLHMGWGLDVHWAAVAAERGWPVGVVDATAVRHTRPVSASYPRDEAIAEATRFLAERPYLPRHAAQETLGTHRRLP